ncbi:hypothetical protein C8J57DRAFT_1714447, partial [Mycena rebaudengoi]
MPHRRSTVEAVHDPDPERTNLLPDDSASLLMDDAAFHATYHVPASAPLGWNQPTPTSFPVDSAAHSVSIRSTSAPEVPSGPSATHNPLPVTIATVADRYVGDGPLHPSSVVLGKRRLADAHVDDDRHPTPASSSISQHPLSRSYSVHRPSSHEPVQCPM